MSAIHREQSEYYYRPLHPDHRAAKGRGEVATDVDSSHAGLLFVTPIFYRYLLARRPLDGKWITSHVDKTVALLCQRSQGNPEDA